MQEETSKKPSPDELSNDERPHFVATTVFRPNTVRQTDGSPWKPEVPEHSGSYAAQHVSSSLAHSVKQVPVMSSGSLLNGNISREMPEVPADVSSTPSEPETRAGGSIRDRIAALSAAAGVSRLDVTHDREKSRVDVTTGKEQSKIATEKGVAFDVEFQKAPKPRPPPRIVSRFKTKDLERKYQTRVGASQVVNNRDFGTVNNREFVPVNNKEFGPVNNRELGTGEFGPENNRELDPVDNRDLGAVNNSGQASDLGPVNYREFGAVNSKDAGAVRDKSVAFEVSFDDEPRSKRPKDEPGLLQSPFKTFRSRSNRRHQQKSNEKPSQPHRRNGGERSLIIAHNGYSKGGNSPSTFCPDSDKGEKSTSDKIFADFPSSDRESVGWEDRENRSIFEVPILQKRNTFSLDSVSQFKKNASDRDLATVKALNEPACKEESKAERTLSGQERTCDSEVPTLLKRNTFTLDLVSQSAEDASEQGRAIAKALNDQGSRGECKTTKDQQLPSEHLQKRNTFTLDSVSRDGVSVATVLNDLATQNELSSREEIETTKGQDKRSAHLQKRNTFTLDSVSRGGVPTAIVLNDLASEGDSGQKPKEKDLPTEQLQKRNTFTLDSVSREGVPIVNVLSDLAKEDEVKQNKQYPVLSNETSQKRGTFTLDCVSQSMERASEEGVQVAFVLNDLANEEELKQSRENANVDNPGLPDETSQKRSTFTLESVSREIDDAIEKYFPKETAVVDTLAKNDPTSDKKQESSQKRSTFTLDSGSVSLQIGAEEGLPTEEVLSQLAKQEESFTSPVESVEASVQKRGTFTLDSVSQTLEEAEIKGSPATEVLSELAKQEELQPSSMLKDEDSAQKRGTFTLDTVSQTLEEAEDEGIPTVDALPRLASEEERHISVDAPSVGTCPSNPPQNRGTYTLDTVSHAIEEAVEKGIPVSATLNHLAQEGNAQQHTHAHDNNGSTADEFTRGLRRPDAGALTTWHRDEYEASFEDALEQLEDCLTFESEEAFLTPSNHGRPFSGTPGNRGTYDLDDVSTSLSDDSKDGVPVVETLDRLSRTSDLSKEAVAKTQPSEEKRGTYTLDEVSRSLQTASEEGIPVVEALQNLAKTKEKSSESVENEEGVGKRGTYTLDEVSKSLEHANRTGVPVIEALESLSKEKRKSPLRLKIPDRGTYTLDEVSLTLEKAKQRGLPVVDMLGHLTAPKDSPVRQTPDAVLRRQGKLVNRKTYALASPLETIGEGTKLRLYDGNQRQMMSPISFNVKSNEVTTSKANTTESKGRGLGVVQKLDFLTSACELLLEANAKGMAKDQQRTESTRNISTSDESVRGSDEADGNPYRHQTERNTYSLERVSMTIDDAKAKGIPVVETLRNVTTVAKPSTTQSTNLVCLNSKSDSELINDDDGKENPDRYTHSLENVSRTLEDAKKAGIPVIEALDQLTNELAEFSLTAMSGKLPVVLPGKDNRKRKRYSEMANLTYQGQSPHASSHGSPYPPPIRKAYSLDDVAIAVKQAFQTGTSLTDLLDNIAFEKPAQPVNSSKDVRPRSVDSGFVSSFSDNDISLQSFESPRNRSYSYAFDSSNEELDLAKIVSPGVKETAFNTIAPSRSSSENQDENRRTFTLDHVGELSRGIPVIEALEKISNSAVPELENTKQFESSRNAKNVPTDATLTSKSDSGKKQSPPKPKRQFFKKTKLPLSDSDSFVIEFFDSKGPQQPTASKYQLVNNKAEQVVDALDSEKVIKDTENVVSLNGISTSSVCSRQNISKNTANDGQVSLDKHAVDVDLVPTRDPDTVVLKSKEPIPMSSSTPTRGRATWRPSGSVLDKIASLMDAAEDSGINPADVLNQVTDLQSETEGLFT